MSYLYRLLRPDEWDAQTKGIAPKRPDAKVSVLQHIAYGSNNSSKYISTSASWGGILEFARHSTVFPKKVAQINRALLTNVEVIDLTDPHVRIMHLGGDDRANNFANKFEEVLIVGYIPPECVTAITVV